jgi:hypothetical protein
MNPMNRCKKLLNPALLAALLAALAPLASAQTANVPNTQEEAARGGRGFPAGTLRGEFGVVNWPEIRLDGQAERLAPGARIWGMNRMLVTPAAITGQNLLVNYTRDAAGAVREVWILTPEEAATRRATASELR